MVVSRLIAVLLTSALVVGTAACKKDATDPGAEVADDPNLLAEDGTDSAAVETDTEVLTSSLVSATAAGGSLSLSATDLSGGTLGAAGVGAGAKAIYRPKGCLTVTADAPAKTVTYAFAGCFGPNGLGRLTGTLVATYAVTADKLTLDIVGTDLTLNRSTVDWTSHAEITAAGADRQMVWKASLSGTTARGKDFARTNGKTVTWRYGDRCFSVSGVSEGDVRGRYLRVQIADFKRCQGTCPEAGGRITIATRNDKAKVEILFDGTNTATFTTPKGSIRFDLACQG